jgi:hypothetical protein
MGSRNGKKPTKAKKTTKKANRVKIHVPKDELGVTLNERELKEFIYRAQCLDMASAHLRMIQEAYRGWLVAISKKYEIEGNFEIDTSTGELVRVAE